MGRHSLLLAVLVTACGGLDARPRSAPPPSDDAVELAALLPDDVERCVVARPGLVPERRRSLVLLHSLAEPTAWAVDLRPIAYATAVAERSDGRRARRTYYRFADDADERVRDVLSVRWLDEPCDGADCARAVARWIDDRTLEVARHDWPRRTMPIPSGACVQLAGAHLDAVEVALDRTSTLGLVPLSEPRPSRWVMTVSPSGLSRRREVVMADPLEARLLAARLGDNAYAEPDLVPFSSGRRRVEREGERVSVVELRGWEELELAIEDEQLRLRASAIERERREPVPVSRVRVSDLGAVRHQVELRRAQLGRLPPEQRERAAAELATLLARGFEAHPSELAFARALVRLALDVLGDPARARDVAASVLARGLGEPREWHLLTREALARLPGDELARVLAAEGVPRADATRGAEDLRALVERGVSYEWAEGAWRASREMLEARAMRRAEARVPFEGVLGALVAWARLASPSRPMSVHALVRSAAPGEVRAIGDSRPELLALRAPSGGMVYVGAFASADLVALRRMGAALAELAAGATEVVVSVRDPDGAPIAELRVAGTMADRVLVVDRASPELANVRWGLLTRYLAQPLAELSTGLFPSPTLTVRAESDELASELWREVEASHPDACRTAGPILRCRTPGWPEQLGEILLRIAATRIIANVDGR